MKTVILPIPTHRIFEDAARFFAQELCDDTLCFGVQDWSLEQIQEQRSLAQRRLIAYQSEIMYGGRMPFCSEPYMEKLRLFDEVWDTTEFNLEYLQNQGVVVKHKPLLPSAVFRDNPKEKDIDILHYGSFSFHRAEMFDKAIAAGFNIYDVLTNHHQPLFGEDLHQLILRSKVVLGFHSFLQGPIQESFRYQYPLSNDIRILAEKSLSNPLNVEEFDGTEEMVEKLKKYAVPHPVSQEEVFERYVFAQYSSCLVEAKRNYLNESLSDQLSHLLTRTSEDLSAANYLKQVGKRSEEVKAVECRVFDDLLRITQTMIRHRKDLSAQETRSLTEKLRRIYRNLQKKSVKKALLATGGKVMPRIRCALLLHGWPLFLVSLKIAVALHRDNKLILSEGWNL